MENSTEYIKPVIDGISATLGDGVFFGYIQALVGRFTIGGFDRRIWETKTVQGLINTRS